MVSSAIIRRRRGSTSLLSLYAVLGIRPELALDFDDELYFKARTPSTFSNTITHSASSNATMVDSDGFLKWRPHNLVTYSEQFDNAAWIKGDTTVTANAAVAPDGTTTAAEISHTSTTANFYNTITVISGATYTASIYAKYIDHQWFRLVSDIGSVWFDIQNGTKGNEQAGVFGTITSVGNGWYLLTATYVAPDTSAPINLLLADGNGSFTEATSTSAYIWGAHLYRSDLGGMVNNPDRGDSYVPTTSAASYLPRRGHHVYNGSAWVNEGLLHESEARTNLVPLSVPNVGWPTAGTTMTPNDITSPTGSIDATKVVSNTSNIEHYIEETFSVTSGTQYTFSVFLKKLGYTNIQFRIPAAGFADNAVVQLNMDTGVASLGTGTIDSFGVQDFGNGWLRVHMVRTANSNNTALFRIQPNTISPYVGDDASGAYVWGAQAEAGPTPSSYIPNAGATAGARREAETLTIPAANLPWPTPELIGPELVTNGTFDTDISGWTDQSTGSGSISWLSGSMAIYRLNGSNRGKARQDISGTSGKVYKISMNVLAGSTTGAFINVNGSTIISTVPAGNSGTGYFVSDGSDGIEIFAAGDAATALVDNISVREINPLAVSIQMDGRVTYADTGVYNIVNPFDWAINTSNKIDTSLGGTFGTGELAFRQLESGVFDQVVTPTSFFNPGVLVPLNIASRHGSTFIAGAVDGVDIGDDLTPVALPDLSATNLILGKNYNGTIRTFRIWADDIGDTGLVEATEPSLVPSLSLTFDGTESSFIVEDWSE